MWVLCEFILNSKWGISPRCGWEVYVLACLLPVELEPSQHSAVLPLCSCTTRTTRIHKSHSVLDPSPYSSGRLRRDRGVIGCEERGNVPHLTASLKGRLDFSSASRHLSDNTLFSLSSAKRWRIAVGNLIKRVCHTSLVHNHGVLAGVGESSSVSWAG